MSNSKYSIKWKRDSSKPRPEDEMDIDSRREAVDKILEELGIEEQIEQNQLKDALEEAFHNSLLLI
jgi:anti-sigma regulatory factor (Ser/Thr protein kinase)